MGHLSKFLKHLRIDYKKNKTIHYFKNLFAFCKAKEQNKAIQDYFIFVYNLLSYSYYC